MLWKQPSSLEEIAELLVQLAVASRQNFLWWTHSTIYKPFSSTNVFILSSNQLLSFEGEGKTIITWCLLCLRCSHRSHGFLLGCQGKNPLTINVKGEGWLSFQCNSIVLNNIDDAEGHNPFSTGEFNIKIKETAYSYHTAVGKWLRKVLYCTGFETYRSDGTGWM